eukprot:Clim_evm6s75 gene=Clim_evmTU6s75
MDDGRETNSSEEQSIFDFAAPVHNHVQGISRKIIRSVTTVYDFEDSVGALAVQLLLPRGQAIRHFIHEKVASEALWAAIETQLEILIDDFRAHVSLDEAIDLYYTGPAEMDSTMDETEQASLTFRDRDHLEAAGLQPAAEERSQHAIEDGSDCDVTEGGYQRSANVEAYSENAVAAATVIDLNCTTLILTTVI